jgi:hypothetical protein
MNFKNLLNNNLYLINESKNSNKNMIMEAIHTHEDKPKLMMLYVQVDSI